MTHERVSMDDPRIESAVEELEQLILAGYPDACFEVTRGNDPEGIYLTATVDIDDVDEVMDRYTERLIEFQVEDRLPIFVLSLQPVERIAASLTKKQAGSLSPIMPPPAS